MSTTASFLDTLRDIEHRFEELERQLADPDVTSDPQRLQEIGRERAEIEDVVNAYRELRDTEQAISEAEILANPRNEWTCADRYATDAMFDALPAGWDQSQYQVKPAQAGRSLEDGDVIDLGDRAFEVVHTPGHSPGGIGLFEAKTGVFLSGDIVYDGPLIDDAYHSDVSDYIATLERLERLPVSVVHGGHFPSFGQVRFRQLIRDYLAGHRKPGCHLT